MCTSRRLTWYKPLMSSNHDRKEPQTGSYAPNAREGARSEYLAQYVFSRFGTSLPVLRQEDHGLDLHCTLSERKGRRAWPVAYYSVQVKSTNRPVVFSSRESVEWLVGYPSALLLCVVDKKKARIQVFQTTARFGAAVNLELPERLKLLLNSPAGEGRTLDWDEVGNCKLGPPILEFKTDDLLKDDLVRKYRKVLVYWVLCDSANVRRYQMGMRSVNLPGKYQTNEVPLAPNARYFLNCPSIEIQAKAEEIALELAEWLGLLKLQSGDSLGALLIALRLRHSDPDYSLGRGSALAMDLRHTTAIQASTDVKDDEYVFASLDKLLAELQQKLNG
jgi:hypothetical protein